MNLITILRKSYLAYFLASLILITSFQSCQNEIEDLDSSFSIKTLQEFTIKHVEISENIFNLIKEEKNIDIETFSLSLKKIKTNKELFTVLKKSGISKYEKLLSLFQDLANNTEQFLKTNPQIYNYSELEIEDLITKEIDKAIELNDLSQNTRSCASQNQAAESRCLRSYAIAMGAATISGAISFGIGTFIGMGAASAILVICLEDANDDYQDCLAGIQ